MAGVDLLSRATLTEIDDDDEQDFDDESLGERIAALTEMFPEGVRNKTATAVQYSVAGLKKAFDFSRSATWIVSTSFMVLMLPVIFESEMAQMEQMQLQKQRQILLGPNAATAGGGMPPSMIPPSR